MLLRLFAEGKVIFLFFFFPDRSTDPSIDRPVFTRATLVRVSTNVLSLERCRTTDICPFSSQTFNTAMIIVAYRVKRYAA